MTMIMRGTTPRALTWSGGLIVLAVAAFLLPMLPTIAQQELPRRESNQDEDLRRAEAALQQQAAAQLEQARAQAEPAKAQADQPRGRRNKGEPDNGERTSPQGIAANEACMRCHGDPRVIAGRKLSGETEEMHESIVQLSAAVQEHRARLREMEAKLKQATAKFVEMSPPAEPRFGDVGDIGRIERGQRNSRPDQPRAQEATPRHELEEKRAENARRLVREARDLEMERRVDLEKHNQDRINMLTKQMEQVLRELEAMRQEMRERPNPKPSKEVGNPDKQPAPRRNDREPDPNQPKPREH
jgi:hypothetical protein